jgi:hypothetical protein
MFGLVRASRLRAAEEQCAEMARALSEKGRVAANVGRDRSGHGLPSDAELLTAATRRAKRAEGELEDLRSRKGCAAREAERKIADLEARLAEAERKLKSEERRREAAVHNARVEAQQVQRSRTSAYPAFGSGGISYDAHGRSRYGR